MIEAGDNAPPLRSRRVGIDLLYDPPAIRPRLSTGVVMSHGRASLHAENRHPHAARGPPNFQPCGPLSSIRFRPQDGTKTKEKRESNCRIRDAETREIVGYLFEWNTGDIDPKWSDDIPRHEKDVVYEYA